MKEMADAGKGPSREAGTSAVRREQSPMIASGTAHARPYRRPAAPRTSLRAPIE